MCSPLAPMERRLAEGLHPCSAIAFDRIRSPYCFVADTSVVVLVVAVAVAYTSASAAAAVDNLAEKVQLVQH